MIPDDINPLDNDAFTVIAAWRNGCDITKRDARTLNPQDFPHPLARALWFAICQYEWHPAQRSLTNVVRFAKKEARASDAEWDAFWKRVNRVQYDADDEALQQSARRLKDNTARLKQEQSEKDRQRVVAHNEEMRQRPTPCAAPPQRSAGGGRRPEEVNELTGRGCPPGEDDFGLGPLMDAPDVPLDLTPRGVSLPWQRRTQLFPREGAAAVPGASLHPQLRAGREGVEPFHIWSVTDAFQPLPPIEYVVEGLLRARGVSFWFGRAGTKKTWLLQWLGMCVAVGRDWLGFKTHPSNVALLDEESGQPRLHYRMRAIINGAGLQPGADIPYVCFVKPRFKVTDPQRYDLLRAQLVEFRTKLVIVDSLARTMQGEENNQKDAERNMELWEALADDLDLHVAMIHHSGKNPLSGYRGSTVFEAVPDIVIEIRSEPDSPYVSLRTTKVRDIQGQKFTARAVWVETGDPARNEFSMERVEGNVEAGERELSPLRQWILDYLEEKGESKMQDIMAAGVKAGVGAKFGVRDAVQELARAGSVYRTNPGDHGVDARYNLADGFSDTDEENTDSY